MLFSALLIGLALAAVPSAAQASLGDAINWARLHGCPHAVRGALRDSAQLQRAVERMADGASMHAALASTGYLAARSTAVHVSGAASDAQVGNLLAARYCGELTDPQFNDVGAERRGRDAWILLASRAALPGSDAVAVRRQILDLVNQARAGGQRCGGKRFGPAPPLALDATLNAAALAHSKDMAGSGRFDHRGRDGSSPAMRVERAGYGGHLVVGENIAAGPMTPGEVTSGWLESPAHCENIMDPRFTDIGIAFAVNASSSELVYWTQDFAVSRRPHAGGVSR